MTESMQKQCNVSDNKYIYSIFSDLALPPKSDSKSTALSAELRAHRLLWANYNRFNGRLKLSHFGSVMNNFGIFQAHLS